MVLGDLAGWLCLKERFGDAAVVEVCGLASGEEIAVAGINEDCARHLLRMRLREQLHVGAAHRVPDEHVRWREAFRREQRAQLFDDVFWVAGARGGVAGAVTRT